MTPNIMALVHLLYFRVVQYNINVCVMHIPGADNSIADTLSRSQMAKFYQLTPLARQAPDLIPAWPSQSLTNASCNAVIIELPPQLDAPTTQAYLPSSNSVLSTPVYHCQHHHSIITNPTIFLCLQITACVSQILEGVFV